MTTIKELVFYLTSKNAHYPLSDEFVINYRQKKGGYITFAAKTGHPIDPLRCEPNQKWHFIESWLNQNFQKNIIAPDDDANKKVYSRMKCPELMLWFLEAVGVDASKIKDAKKKAEEGKKRNTNVSTIAKEIRNLIPWKDIEDTMKA